MSNQFVILISGSASHIMGPLPLNEKDWNASTQSCMFILSCHRRRSHYDSISLGLNWPLPQWQRQCSDYILYNIHVFKQLFDYTTKLSYITQMYSHTIRQALTVTSFSFFPRAVSDWNDLNLLYVCVRACVCVCVCVW